jgi:putative transposase
MDGGRAQIIERDVPAAPDEAWDVAVRQAEVIGRLTAEPRLGVDVRVMCASDCQ